jgi:hypothetical protein
MTSARDFVIYAFCTHTSGRSNHQLFHFTMDKVTSPRASPNRGDGMPLLSRKRSNTGSGGSGNNSDNSGICSIGNNSFGFNFDTEESMVAPCLEQQQEDSQAADDAVANLASIAKETQGEIGLLAMYQYTWQRLKRRCKRPYSIQPF